MLSPMQAALEAAALGGRPKSVPVPVIDMSHCCIRPYYCVECDKRRADREINRLREVLRTTMDQFLDAKEEAKDLRTQRDDACTAGYDQRQLINELRRELFEVQLSVNYAKKGKITVNDIKVPPEDEIHYEPET